MDAACLVWSCFFLSSDKERFLVAVGSIAAAIFISNLTMHLFEIRPSIIPRWRKPILGTLVTMTAFSSVAGIYPKLRNIKPMISHETLEMTAWINENTPFGAEFLFVTDSFEQGEWLPFLMERTPVIEIGGSEWTGRYYEQIYLFSGVLRPCIIQDSLSCIENMLATHNMNPDILILTHLTPKIIEHANSENEAGWEKGFENHSYVVFSRKEGAGKTRD